MTLNQLLYREGVIKKKIERIKREIAWEKELLATVNAVLAQSK